MAINKAGGISAPLPPGQRNDADTKPVGQHNGRTVRAHKADTVFIPQKKSGLLSRLQGKLVTARKVQTAEHPKKMSRAMDVVPELTGKVRTPPKLGKVKIGQLLGKGASGQVFTADHSRNANKITENPGLLNKNYVVKEQKLGNIRQGGLWRLAHARGEVNMQKAAGVKVLDEASSVGKKGITHKAMMEHGGVDLTQMLPRNNTPGQSVGEAMTRNIAQQLLEQLVEFHGKGCVHRDIKLENVLINHQGKVTLADFGLSVKGVLNPDNDQLVFQDIAGTPMAYSPEVTTGSASSTGCDVWALGYMLYELLTGMTSPFWVGSWVENGQTVHQFRPEVFEFDCQQLSNDPGLSQDAKNLVLAMLDTNSANRPSASQLLKHPFFTDRDNQESFIDLQRNHKQTFDQLALLEARHERALKKKHRKTSADEISQLETRIQSAGNALKVLQQKMEQYHNKIEKAPYDIGDDDL